MTYAVLIQTLLRIREEQLARGIGDAGMDQIALIKVLLTYVDDPRVFELATVIVQGRA